MERVSVFCKREDSELYHTNMSLSLENLQTFVGGYIEVVPIGTFGGQVVVMICDEEGKLKPGTGPNFLWDRRPDGLIDWIFGDVVFASTVGDQIVALHGRLKPFKSWLRHQGMEV